jgi:GNAT superfamily N-acetyltransferase
MGVHRDAGRTTIRRAELTDMASVEAIARTTWPMTYAGIIPDDLQRRLLDRWYSPKSCAGTSGRRARRFWRPSGVEPSSASRSTCVGRRNRWSSRGSTFSPTVSEGGIGGRLLDAALAEFTDEGLRLLTVCVERDNVIGRRFYEKMGFAEPRALTQTLQGYPLALIEYRRPIP